MKLLRYEVISGEIRNTEGLRIGGSRETADIGDTDNPILRHPISRLPYIPGSSLKGKLRSLLEQKYCGNTQEKGKPCGCGNRECVVCSVFGCGEPSKNDHEPTRIIMRDASLKEESAKELKMSMPGFYAEVKMETAINRNTGGVQNATLRSIERIPAGMKFHLQFTLRVFEEDSGRLHDYFLKLGEAFEMLEKDYLGGCGTRGCGAVEVFGERSKRMHEFLREKAKELKS